MPRIQDHLWPLAVILAAVLLASPLWCVTMPGMPDYPAHLASFALIAGETSRYYVIQWAALPNLASEALVPLFSHVMPLESAARLFLTTAVLLWVLGAALIQRTLFGRVGPGALLPALFVYNANFTWGFFNYSFAVGLAFVTFAAWIATEGRRNALHLFGFTLAFTLLYYSHLFGFAVLLLAIGGYELPALLSERFAPRALARRVLTPLALCLPAVIAFLALRPAGTAHGRIAFNILDTLRDRFEAAIDIGFDNPGLPLTAALILLFAAAVWTGRAVMHPRMRIALALLTLAALFAPEWALGGWGVHMRLPPVLGALAFASLDWKLRPRTEAIGAAAVLAILAVIAGLVTADWRLYDAQYREFRAHADAIPRGAKIMVALDGDSLGMTADQPYWHLAEFAIIDRDVFTPLMFTTAGQHVVNIRHPFDRHAARTARQGSPPDIDELEDLAKGNMEADEDYASVYPYLKHFQCSFDQVIAIEGPGPHARVPAMLRLRVTGSFYRLYDVVPDGCAKR